MNNKISLAGDLGSGKSTVSKILIERLGAEYYSTGTAVRSVAERMGMSVVELNHYMESHPEIDEEIDNGLRELANDPRSLIIDSRMAWHFTKGTFPVYLSVDAESAAVRIMCANRTGEHSDSVEATVRETRERRASEKLRYSERYGVDITDLSNYALVVDTTYATPDEIAEAIITAFDKWQKDKSYRALYVSPERLYYPDDAPDELLLEELTSALECGEDIPEVLVFESDGEFYIESGAESALARSFSMQTFIPARLVTSSAKGRSYVKMKNSL